MTIIENRTMELICSACKTFINHFEKKTPIDWEQRRYEIAKEMLPQINGTWENERRAKFAVTMADALIKELKETKTIEK